MPSPPFFTAAVGGWSSGMKHRNGGKRNRQAVRRPFVIKVGVDFDKPEPLSSTAPYHENSHEHNVQRASIA
jgi:hypothetical protein